MFDLRKANRWKLPRVTFHNAKKEFPNMSPACYAPWFRFQKFWSGRIREISVRQFTLKLDFRLSFKDDLAFPDATKQDRKAVDDAL